MDVEAFAAELPRRFDSDLHADHPADRKFASVVERVPGMSTEHALTLLNLAVEHLGEDECYLEIGTYRGRSVVGAMLGQNGRTAVAIENFAEFGGDPSAALREVEGNLHDFGVADRVHLQVRDAFRGLGRDAVPRPVGVYFYDGAHSRVAQHLGLAMVEPLLADEALVVVDDASWPQVRSTTQHYLARHPGYRVVADLAAETDFDPRWCNGLLVLGWRRPPGSRPPLGWELTWRRAAHFGLLAPARSLAYRFLPRFPHVRRLVEKVYLHGGTSVPDGRADASREG